MGRRWGGSLRGFRWRSRLRLRRRKTRAPFAPEPAVLAPGYFFESKRLTLLLGQEEVRFQEPAGVFSSYRRLPRGLDPRALTRLRSSGTIMPFSTLAVGKRTVLSSLISCCCMKGLAHDTVFAVTFDL